MSPTRTRKSGAASTKTEKAATASTKTRKKTTATEASASQKAAAATRSPRPAKASAAAQERATSATPIELPVTFARKPKLALLHQAVVRDLANRRAGTADTKKRDEVSGGGRKPWRQKGTGRARQGSIRSPLWRKGGVVFGPHPRSFAKGMNRRARRAALAMAIAAKNDAGALSVIDASELQPKKTKELLAVLWPQASKDSVLLAIHVQRDKHAKDIYLAGRNLARAKVMGHDDLSVHSILRYDRLILSEAALAALAEVSGG